jgi:CBS domain-containing protein
MMLARDLMTKKVVSVPPDMPVNEIARLLLRNTISAAPVVDANGALLGMVSEGDLIGRNDSDREARRDWWLALLAEGEELNPDFLSTLRRSQRKAREVMVFPVITVTETTDAAEIARLLKEHRIKRVPVVRDERVVGIVSRADLLDTVAL